MATTAMSTVVPIDATHVGFNDACRALGVSRPTLRNWIDAGHLHAVKHGLRWRIPRASLAAFIERGTAPADAA